MRILKLGLMLLSLAVIPAIAQTQINGKWKATFTSPDGQTRENTFDFKVEGETLTGTVSSPRGESKIEDGKINGDEIMFSVTRNVGGGGDVKFTYKGKVVGNEIKFSVEGGDRNFEMVAKRAAT